MIDLIDPENYALSPYSVPVIIVGGLVAALGLAVVARERMSSASLSFLAVCGSVCIWLVWISAVYSSRTEEVALVAIKAALLGIVFIPTAIFVMATSLAGRMRELRAVVVGCVLFSAILYSSVLLTDSFVTGIESHFWGFYPRYGYASVPFLVFFAVLLTASVYIYFAAYRRQPEGAQKQRIGSLLAAFLISYVAAVDLLAAYGVAVYPFGYAPILVFVVIAARAIWRYRLTDITPSYAAEKIIETMSDALFVVDRDGIVRVANERSAEIFGESASGLVGKRLPLPIDEVLAGTEIYGKNAISVRDAEVAYRGDGGRERVLNLCASPMVSEEGEVIGLVCVVRDVTERKRIEEDLRESEERSRSLIDSTPDIIFDLDRDGTIAALNPAFEELTGWSKGEWLGKPFSAIVHADDVATASRAFAKKIQGEDPPSIEIRLVMKSGEYLDTEVIASRRIEHGAITGLIGFVRDVTARKQLEEAWKKNAFEDFLTGLPNRRHFFDSLSRSVAQAKRSDRMLGLLYFDLDDFKSINDAFGHSIGDEVLKAVGQRASNCIREGDMVARIGGDEFTVILSDVATRDEATEIARRIADAIRRPINVRGKRIRTSASVGIAIHPQDGTDPETLLKKADDAMYEAKSRPEDSSQIPIADISKRTAESV